ncbi:histidinol-phosphate transaminase [Microbacterium maritypicum]|uniref:histidinol-phosphate transaminase n=1 Tax=Microbacterium maritypicum TaxID=33918 RepID=UPI00296EFFF7|nr:histidinol-phosphate transaminase [Microbacterium liquefaciens]
MSAGARPAVRADLRSMAGYHSPQVDVDVRLNTNESPLEPPPEFTAALAEGLRGIAWNRYPDRSAAELRAAIAAAHPGVGPDEVFVANGSNEVLQTLCLTFGGAGSAVAVFEPTYAMYAQIARTTQCRVVEVERDDEYRVAPAAVAEVVAADRPALLFLCLPNNPTGTAETPETVTAALAVGDGVVVVDEAYGQFAGFSALELRDRPGAADRLVVVRTFSKTWALAGLRLGYAIAPAWMVAEFDKVVLPYHVDSFKQLAGRLALRFSAEMDERVAAVVVERTRVSAALAEMGLRVWPSEANFVLVSTTPTGHRGDDVWQGLLDRSVLVRNFSSRPRLADCLRVSVGTSDENDRLLSAAADVLAGRPAP